MGESTSDDRGKPVADDPSMEDILASIRRILSDDDAHPGPAASPGHAPASPVATPDDVFVLDHSMLIEEPAKMALENPPERPTPPPPAPSPFPPDPPMPAALPATPAAHTDADGEPLLAPAAAAAASASMGALVRVLGQQQTEVYRGGPTLEDMVRDELRPIVKAWLDENLPPIVERMVRAEIARVTNGK